MIRVIRDVIHRGFRRGRENPSAFDVMEFRGVTLTGRHNVGNGEWVRETSTRGRVVVPQSRSDRWQNAVNAAAILVSHHHHLHAERSEFCEFQL